MSGFVSLVGAGPGDPELITVKGLRALQEADVVLYDSLASPELVEGLDAELIFVGKRCGLHAMSQESIHALIVGLARRGKRVVRLKGGDPLVLGRGGEEALELRAAGVPFEIVPGISSALAVPAAAGIPLTQRGVSEGFTVITAHRRSDDEDFAIPPYTPRRTLVLLMGVRTIRAWTDQLRAEGYPADVPVAFVVAGTTPEQRVVVSSLAEACEDAAAHGVESPCVVVVGETVRLAEVLGDATAHARSGGVTHRPAREEPGEE